MSQQSEYQGFINVKIPSRMMSRSFIPWKTWKRQWVVVRRSRNGVELLIGRTSQTIMQILPDDIICRTESRTQHYAFGVFPQKNKRRANIYLSGTSETDSQKWISAIRKLLKPPLIPVEDNEFSVSVIDNMFSRSAGLSGLYGTLRILPDQVTIVDPFTAKNKAEWSWSTLSQFHVSSTIAREDKGHICTIVTSRLFPTGVGQIHLFCTESLALTSKLQNKGRAASLVSSSEGRLSVPYRHHTFSCACPEKQTPIHLSASQAILGKSSSVPKNFMLNRRLSRSEGNLLSVLREMDSTLYGFLEPRNNCHSPFSGEGYDSEDIVSLDSNESYVCKGKVAPGIISAGLGLILSTPGGSEGDNESLHEYQRLQYDDDDDELMSLSFSVPTNKFSPPRRESGVSIASGVYEEIDDVPINIDFSKLDIAADKEVECPPPLPPRRELSSKNINEDDSKSEYISMLQVPSSLNRFLSRSAGNTPLPSPPSFVKSQTAPPSSEILCPKSSSWMSEECDYLPMFPSCGFRSVSSKTEFASKESLEDSHYMVMSSIKST